MWSHVIFESWTKSLQKQWLWFHYFFSLSWVLNVKMWAFEKLKSWKRFEDKSFFYAYLKKYSLWYKTCQHNVQQKFLKECFDRFWGFRYHRRGIGREIINIFSRYIWILQWINEENLHKKWKAICRYVHKRYFNALEIIGTHSIKK